MNTIAAVWPAPPGVRVFTTTRAGGTSPAPYDSLNLGDHVGDDPDRVAWNRRLVVDTQGWTTAPLWLDQVHGTTVVDADASGPRPQADGAVTRRPHRPLVVLTADCLPVALALRSGAAGALVHAGWRGLAAGVVEAGVRALGPADQVVAWIGPAIGAASYQVGTEVRDAFLAADPAAEAAFAPDGPGRWRFDLPGAAAQRLAALGIPSITLSGWDTAARTDLFFSHRRQTLVDGPSARCGRQATFLVLTPEVSS